MKRLFEVLGWLTAVAILALAGHAVYAQQAERRVTVTVVPAQPVEERVADEIKAKELRKAAEEKLAAEESAKAVEANPKSLLSRARTVYIESGTSFFDPVQLQNALLKREEMSMWRMVIVEGHDKRNVADLLIEVDRPLFTYTFAYRVTHRSTGVILSTGEVTAFDGNAASPKLADKIVEEIRKARGEKKAEK